ncbi:MAG: helix-turn-helix transcriptional regulator [Aliishimia sp.]
MGEAADNWYDPNVATFGDRLAAAREQTNLTQAALAKRLGVKASTVRKWEDDLAEPRANRLSMLAGLLGVSMGWLITGVGEGVEAPDTDTLGADMTAMMAELREIRMAFTAKAEQIGRIEKRLRKMIQEGQSA